MNDIRPSELDLPLKNNKNYFILFYFILQILLFPQSHIYDVSIWEAEAEDQEFCVIPYDIANSRPPWAMWDPASKGKEKV